VSATGALGQRIAVFVAFAALAAAAASALVAGAPVAAPTGAELAALEAKMAAAAHLHPAAAITVPAGPAAWCAECHPGFLHAGAGVGPAMRNEHAARMDCLLCHWSGGGPRPSPVWQVLAGSTSFLTVLPRDRSSKDQLAALRSAAMAGRRCFERGPACADCHRQGVIGALARPGITPMQLAALERLESHFALKPGEKWYFPRIQ